MMTTSYSDFMEGPAVVGVAAGAAASDVTTAPMEAP
jgi:hypothetical protein